MKYMEITREKSMNPVEPKLTFAIFNGKHFNRFVGGKI